MAEGTVRVKGLKEFIRAADRAGKETKKQVRDRLREAGTVVRDDARGRLASIDAGSAAGLRTVVHRASLVSVEQSRKRTTGLRGDYGSLQMREVLLPSLADNEAAIEREFERALDDIADIFERG